MKDITLPHAGFLTALAAMLEMLDYPIDDVRIALDMEAPYLFIQENGAYICGAMLYKPRWLNLYLHARGFHLAQNTMPKDAVAAFLRAQTTAMLPVHLTKNVYHPVVFTGYHDGRYTFRNVKPSSSEEPEQLSYSTSMLKRRLDEDVTVFTLEYTSPQPVNYIPHMLNSLRCLNQYWVDFCAIHQRTVTREELRTLHRPYLRALLQDLLPMAILLNDDLLFEELRCLNHEYRHIFTLNSPERVAINTRIPKHSVKQCILWLKEDIVDRLYELGCPEETILEYIQPC